MKIMVCYDGSDDSMEGLKLAMNHAKVFNAEIILVNSVVRDSTYSPKMMQPLEQMLQEAQALCEENNIPCKTYISYRGVTMDAGEDLVEFARREQVDEVIVGIRARSRVGKFMLGSVAQWLMLKAECPVIGVKKKMTH